MPALALLAAAVIAGPTLPGPWAPAAEGRVQCVVPDTASKTCLGVSGYRIENGKIINWAKVVISRGSPAIILEGEETVWVKDGQVCSADSLNTGKIRFTVGDRPATPEEAKVLRQQIKTFVSWMRDGDSCTEIVERDGVLLNLLHAAGQKGEMAQKFMWITPGTGYQLATW